METSQDGTTRWTPPSAFAEYQLLWSLGRGGMGEVYLGHDLLLDRPVAIKFIFSVESDEHNRQQFLAEARAAARLQHPNVVTVHRVGEIDGRPYIISEYIRGQNLEALAKPITWQRALTLGVGLARGLAAAHRRGVLHRDIKPGNAIFADDGEIKLLDFGLAKCIESTGSLSRPGEEPSEQRQAVESTAPTIDVTAVLSGNTTPSAVRVTVMATTPETGSRLAEWLPSTAETPRNTAGPVPFADTLTPKSSSLTSTVKGTPMYMAPEVLGGAAATRRSDIYSMGALLFELCAGAPPHYDVPMEALVQVVPHRSAPPLRHVAPDTDSRFAAIVDRCLRLDPQERFASAEELKTALELLLPATTASAVPEGNPYRGLLPFEAEHRGLFFGRRSEIGTLIERLRTDPCVLIAADSGLGKSSLCRAGLVPLLHEGALGNDRVFLCAELTPGRRPVAALAAALATTLGGSQTAQEEERLAQLIAEQPERLGSALQQLLGPERGLVLLVDQVEELVALALPGEANQVAEALGSLMVKHPAWRLLLTVRSDQLGRVAALPGIGAAVAQSLYSLRSLHELGLHEVIVGPAHARGGSFESPDLVSSLVEFGVRSPGGLPLLQVALAELWEVRQTSCITAETLTTVGGLRGLVTRHADRVVSSLPPTQRVMARQVLLALCPPGADPAKDAPKVRRSEDDIQRLGQGEVARATLESLIKGRIVLARNTAEGATYELAHDALLADWETLKRWRSEEVVPTPSSRSLRSLRLLASELRPPVAEPMVITQPTNVARPLSRWAIVVPLVVLFAVFAVRELASYRTDKQLHATMARGQQALAQARARAGEVEKARLQALAAIDWDSNRLGTERWEQVQQDSAEADRAYGEAGSIAEEALGIDSQKPELRGLLGDILFERAVLAEWEQQQRLMEELLHRMVPFDEAGERRRRFSALSTVHITSVPAAAVSISSLRQDGHEFVRTRDRPLGITPAVSTALLPGAYLLTFKTPEGQVVHRPLLVGHGVTTTVNIELGRAPSGP